VHKVASNCLAKQYKGAMRRRTYLRPLEGSLLKMTEVWAVWDAVTDAPAVVEVVKWST
jgi:hypothetical protein